MVIWKLKRGLFKGVRFLSVLKRNYILGILNCVYMICFVNVIYC